eukprot:COSAG04_NODE_27155_length_286_cov_0.721925_1_plen_38_part_10
MGRVRYTQVSESMHYASLLRLRRGVGAGKLTPRWAPMA